MMSPKLQMALNGFFVNEILTLLSTFFFGLLLIVGNGGWILSRCSTRSKLSFASSSMGTQTTWCFNAGGIQWSNEE